MPSTMASAEATLWMATSKFATSFIRVPFPNAPTSWTARVNAAKAGRVASMAAESPLA